MASAIAVKLSQLLAQLMGAGQEFLHCAKYFKKYSQVSNTFAIFKVSELDFWSKDVNKLDRMDEMRLTFLKLAPDTRRVPIVPITQYGKNDQINSAIEEESCFKLAYDSQIGEDAYLFGRQLWTISTKEHFLNEEELRLIFLETIDKERTKFERLKKNFSGAAGDAINERRDLIPEDVRIYVWRRDEGKCVKCGSQEKLEFDHIIPYSKGGSSTARNIQLLCERCNREKHNSI